MSANKLLRQTGARGQGGVAAVEFALVVLIFLVIVFGIMELARSMYLFNTLKEVTRRAASSAASADFRDQSRLDQIRQGAIFRQNAGALLLGDPVTDATVRIDYLAATRDAGGKMALTPIPAASMPSCPARNKVNCMRDPNDASCIRFVRARICQSGGDGSCTPLRYQTAVPLIDMGLALPTSPTIVAAESLGFVQGAMPCP